jgi:hypothetical protein
MNQKFDVKNYRIVENKELLKEELATAGIIGLLIILAGLIGGGAYLMSKLSFGRVYGTENGKNIADAVQNIKKTLEDAIEGIEEDDKKTAAKNKLKDLINAYQEAVLAAGNQSDEGARKTAVENAFNAFKTGIEGLNKDYNLNADVEQYLNEIGSTEALSQQEADEEFKKTIMLNLGNPESFRGIIKRVFQLYSANTKTQRTTLMFFKKVIPVLKRTKKIYNFFTAVNDVVANEQNNQIILKLLNIRETKTLAKLDQSSIPNYIRNDIRQLLMVDKRKVVYDTIKELLGEDTTAPESATTGSTTTAGDEYKLDSDEKNNLLKLYQIFELIANKKEITVEADPQKIKNAVLKFDKVFEDQPTYESASNALGMMDNISSPVTASAAMGAIVSQYNEARKNTGISEALKTVFDKNIQYVSSIDLQNNYEGLKDEFVQSLHAISEVATELSTLTTGSLDTITKKGASPSPAPASPTAMPESLNATLQDGTLVCEGCLVEYMNNHKNLITEAKYQGRSVPLGKPMRGDVKKFKVFVKDPSTGNIKKVNFGDPNMKIKKNIPARRKSFRARHKCATAKDRTSARYWSCRMWEHKQLDESINNRMKELAGLIED